MAMNVPFCGGREEKRKGGSVDLQKDVNLRVRDGFSVVCGCGLCSER